MSDNKMPWTRKTVSVEGFATLVILLSSAGVHEIDLDQLAAIIGVTPDSLHKALPEVVGHPRFQDMCKDMEFSFKVNVPID